jgi:branched-chain amino acid aminotransferase
MPVKAARCRENFAEEGQVMEKIKIERTDKPKAKPDLTGIPFGTYFTDHMFLMDYVKGQGWLNPRIVPYGPLTLDPAAMVFHYAQEIFEGMKAYRTAAGSIQLFRPQENFRRMNRSAERMAIPPLPEEFVLGALTTFLELEQSWVPFEPDASLYIRPFIIATDPYVGIHASHTYLFAIIACPVGSYYAAGLNPVKIMIENEDARAVRGGTGFAKCGGNYAASIRAGERAAQLGYEQVLWLDGVHQKYVEEVGSMNVWFKISGEVVTPALNGSVLPGITRKSCLEVLRSWNVPVTERLISIDELIAAAQDGSLEEAWGSGTAAVISPIGEICYQGTAYLIGKGEIGALTQKLYDTLTGIQWGKIDDPFGWIVKL